MAPFVPVLMASLLGVAWTAGPTDCPRCQAPTLMCSASSIPVKCAGNDDSCISVEDANTGIGNTAMTGSAKSCAKSADNLNGSLAFEFGDGVYLKIASRLCNDTNCQASFDRFLIQNILNGKYCPKCYKPGYESCEDNGTVLCRGDMVDCTAIHGKISEAILTTGMFVNITCPYTNSPNLCQRLYVYRRSTSDTTISFAAKGCVSKSVCSLPTVPMTISSGVFSYTFVSVVPCKAANSAFATVRRATFTLDRENLGPQMAFFFPSFLGFFVVKILS
ncbi:uncharacterized protein LOC133370870 [Rhineura floridana]|uniref:uncharacterized protein LOC133370870 n=1 Tax=Rhineura floridana TaxID=261503 RepID=UPI002AC870A6|nr:uncharacterized protein LOC133370870 [Rhineura floridana]